MEKKFLWERLIMKGIVLNTCLEQSWKEEIES